MSLSDPRSGIAAAGLTAAAIGSLGVDGGLLWLIGGVWTARAMAATPVGAAWGLACLGAGLRWGSLDLGDLQVATRLVGPTVAAGQIATRTGMVLALAGALLGEAALDGMRGRSVAERAAAMLAVAALVPLFCVEGASAADFWAVGWWVGWAIVLTVVVLLTRPVASRLPPWAPAGVVLAGLAVSAGAA